MISGAPRRGLLLTFAAALFACAAVASGQDVPLEDQPIGRYVLDARAAFPNFKQDPNIARSISVTAPNLPTRALGFVLGAHFYPARLGPMTLGLGGELMMAGRSRTLPAAEEGGVAGPTVRSEISSITPQISFNFGKRQGWSYISGGLGATAFTAERQEAPLPPQDSRARTYNYGGGARWFANTRVAVAVDLRFYAISAQEQVGLRPAFSRMTLIVISAGAAFK